MADDDGTGRSFVNECDEENNFYNADCLIGEIRGTKFNDLDGNGVRKIVSTEFFGPTPYLSFEDSPFSELEFSEFYLEDFEDATLKTLGVSVTFAVDPGVPFTIGWQNKDNDRFGAIDSVDADDSNIDGSGSDGGVFGRTSARGGSTYGFEFTFDEDELGSLPTHVGIVWTDYWTT